MATPRVALRLIKRKKQSLYQLDYSVNGKRIRTTVGPSKKDAELVRAKIQSDLVLGTYGIPTSTNSSITLADLIRAFLNNKKNQIRQTSVSLNASRASGRAPSSYRTRPMPRWSSASVAPDATCGEDKKEGSGSRAFSVS